MGGPRYLRLLLGRQRTEQIPAFASNAEHGRLVTGAQVTRCHNCIGHNYIGHNYIGHELCRPQLFTEPLAQSGYAHWLEATPYFF